MGVCTCPLGLSCGRTGYLSAPQLGCRSDPVRMRCRNSSHRRDRAGRGGGVEGCDRGGFVSGSLQRIMRYYFPSYSNGDGTAVSRHPGTRPCAAACEALGFFRALPPGLGSHARAQEAASDAPPWSRSPPRLCPYTSSTASSSPLPGLDFWVGLLPWSLEQAWTVTSSSVNATRTRPV